jgi:hypothetical protein
MTHVAVLKVQIPLADPHVRQVGPSFGETVALLPHIWPNPELRERKVALIKHPKRKNGLVIKRLTVTSAQYKRLRRGRIPAEPNLSQSSVMLEP